MKKELTQYYRKISRCLPIKKAQRQQTMEQIRLSVKDYLAAHPEADMAAVTAHFGAPQEIAASYIENMTPEEILKKMRFRKTVLIAVVTVLTAAFLLWVAVVGSALANELNQDGGFIVVEPAKEIYATEYDTTEGTK